MTCSNTLQDVIAIDKHTHYISCGDIAGADPDLVKGGPKFFG